MTYGLGIDTGGTFTDAVLLDENQQVVATAKSLTTHFDLAQGIAGALAQLPQAQLQAVNLVCLSTTLTTNSVVEGTLVFEREVELLVHASAKVGTVTGATAQAYTDKLPPRE